ncbi:MAG: porin [Rhizobiaceae bacterium]
MKIKSLLLGSAAALVAVSGARAADAIVVEPEPVEYVRVCDAYGAGWFYIPGTETCLKIDGDVRVDYSSIHWHDNWERTAVPFNSTTGAAAIAAFDSETSSHDARYRGRFNIRANNETEYGTLSSRIRFYGQISGTHTDTLSAAEGISSAPVALDWAVISLAGFRVGFADNYWTTAGGYGYYGNRFDGLYGYTQGLFLDYTWASNGWTATIGIEDGGFGYAPYGSSGTAGQPDVYAGLTYSGSGWYLAGIYYYDSSASAGAYKIRADYDISSFLPGGSIGGWYMADHGDTDWVKGHTWGVTARMNLTDNMQLFAGYSDYADQARVGAANLSQTNWTVGVNWSVVPGLTITPEYTATWFENENALVAAGNVPVIKNFGRFNLRIVRSF